MKLLLLLCALAYSDASHLLLGGALGYGMGHSSNTYSVSSPEDIHATSDSFDVVVLTFPTDNRNTLSYNETTGKIELFSWISGGCSAPKKSNVTCYSISEWIAANHSSKKVFGYELIRREYARPRSGYIYNTEMTLIVRFK